MEEKKKYGEPETWLTMAGTKSARSILIFVCCSFGPFFSALNILSYQFLGATPKFWCNIEDLSSYNFTWEQIRNLSTPYETSNVANDDLGCKMHEIDYSQLSGKTFDQARSALDLSIHTTTPLISCPSREFDPSFDTIVTKWDLVCDQRYVYSSVQAAVQGGILVGSVIFGYLIDRYGRLLLYKICVLGYLLTGLLTSVSNTISLFIILKLASSTFGMGYYLSGIMLAMEHCSAQQRSLIGNYYVLPWAFGMMAVPGIAYLVRPWYYLQIALILPSLLLIPNFWILLESPRWLIMKGRFDDAYSVLEKLAKSSKRNFPDREDLVPEMKEWRASLTTEVNGTTNFIERAKESLLFVLSPFRLMLKRTLGIFFCWFSVSMVYYGVSLGSTTLSANDYIYMLIGGALEVPSYLLLWPAVVFLGRRKSLIILFFLSGVSILSVMVLILVKFDNYSLSMALYLLGKFAITAAFHLLWVYTVELYPTKFRSLAVGEASSAARIGSMFSPYINDLLYKKAFYSPSALFGVFSVMAGAVCFMFPETTNRNLMEATESEQDIISVSSYRNKRTST